MKKYFAVLVACVVLMCLNVEAQGEPKVIIYGAASGIPNSVVAEIVAENPDAQEITFLKWENAVLDNELVMPLAGWTYSDIVVKTGSTNVTLADKFIISVAKGAKTTLSKEFSATVSASVNLSSSGGQNTGKPSAGQLGVAASVTAKCSVTWQFSGPPESSTANSREYRARFIGDKGTWSATAILQVNPTARPKINGTWSSPTKWAEYSIDKKIN